MFCRSAHFTTDRGDRAARNSGSDDSGRVVGKPEVGSPEVRLRLSCGIQRLAPGGGKVQVAFGLLHFQ
jgi:hypothetical protein